MQLPITMFLCADEEPTHSVGRNRHGKLVARAGDAQPVAAVAGRLLRLCSAVGRGAEFPAVQTAQVGHQLRFFRAGRVAFAHDDAGPAEALPLMLVTVR
jgi:hypothetical protein